MKRGPCSSSFGPAAAPGSLEATRHGSSPSSRRRPKRNQNRHRSSPNQSRNCDKSQNQNASQNPSPSRNQSPNPHPNRNKSGASSAGFSARVPNSASSVNSEDS